MSAAQVILTELGNEMATTRRLLERVPADRGEWKPHPKSFALGHLAQLIARMPGWVTNTLREAKLDLASYPGYSFETTETLLAEFDKNVREASEALAAATDASLAEPWSLVRGDQIFMTMQRGPMVRGHLSHLYHHRGQLTVYLRLVDVPIPSIYGPTADERM